MNRVGSLIIAALGLGLPLFGQAQRLSEQMLPKYIGPGSCSATACHGGVQPRNITPVQQNEYSTWAVQDSHSKAYRSLENPISQRMGRLLGIAHPEASSKCLVCHALSIPESQRGREFDLSEGVSCESCHGPASAWLGPHSEKNSKISQFTSLGMYDLADLQRRSEKCLTCHLGTPEKQVDHAMIAAGHPNLVFELDSYSAIQPPHWKPSPDPNQGVRLWSIGQAVQLREALRRLQRRAQSPNWPEYSELDCYSCHHSLTKPEESWRQARGYADRPPGAAPWNVAHYAVFRIVAKDVDAASSQELESALRDVFAVTAKPASDRTQISKAAADASQVADTFVGKMKSADFSRARTARLLSEISRQGDSLAGDDALTAEQTTMALDSLFISYSKQAADNSGVRAAIDGLFQELQNPSVYSAPRFSAQMRKVNAALQAAGISSVSGQ